MTSKTAITQKKKRLSSLAKRNFNTPQILKGGLYVAWGASLLLAITTISGVQGRRSAIQEVGKNSVPSIITAQRIIDSLAGMDANAVNELLVKPGENPEAVSGYEERRKAFSERIVIAASNITYGDVERKPIETLQLGLGDYITKIQRARDFNERSDVDGVVQSYREAAEIMDNILLPAAEALDKVNSQQLDKIYSQQGLVATGSLFLIIVCSAILLSVLVAIQIFLSYRMRRTLNPMLLAASVIALIFIAHTTQSLLSASNHLRVAKEDAFDSLYALRQSRALAYRMNADESRYLLDKENASKHEQAFFTKANQIVQLPQGKTWNDVTNALTSNKSVPGLSGYFARAMGNITFPGERENLIATISTFGAYYDIDKQIRNLERSGNHVAAIKLCTGYQPGESNWAFEEFKKAHAKVQDINYKAFEKGIEQGFKSIEGFEVTATTATIAIAALTFLGLRKRIQEYEL